MHWKPGEEKRHEGAQWNTGMPEFILEMASVKLERKESRDGAELTQGKIMEWNGEID